MKIFIGSSREAQGYVEKVSLWIEEKGHQPFPWSDPALFRPGEYLLSRLIAISREVDAAVFIFAEDDKVWYRQDTLNQPRDNVLLEYGLFSGALGHAAAIICKVGAAKIPTDAHGIGVVEIYPGNEAHAHVAFNEWLRQLDEQRKIATPSVEEGRASDVKVFRAPTEVKYNHQFYDYFINLIKNAKQDIYIVGEGFECADEEGRTLAKRYSAAFKEALELGINVVRIQTKTPADTIWASMLDELLRGYPNNFQLYVLKKGKVAQMSSVCVIDPEHATFNVVEIMVSTQRLFGTTAADLAGTAIFVEGQQMLARDLRSRILSLKEQDVSVHVADPDDVKTLICGEALYFAYGSNMLEKQMRERCKSVNKIGNGVLRNYKIVFNRKGSYHDGAVASIERSDGGQLWGVIWKIRVSELLELDKIEDPEAYKREKVVVSTQDGTTYSCHAYVAIPQTAELRPDDQYLKTVIEGAKEAGLPDDYIRLLESLKE
jgi:cation transport regulator ChaC